MDLIDEDGDGQPAGNAPEFTVSELSGAVKRVIEGEFSRVRVRGEVSRVSRPASGHLYFDLKDDRAVIAAVAWKGQVPRMAVRPEEGMEIVATGRLTTFPGQSKYQLIVEDIAPAGVGALMVMLEKRKAALAAEGLFAAERKQPLPYLPDVIGVVTSPSGAVIRDILHRLRDRFPSRVLIWPVAVQGEKCAREVAAAIAGFNALVPGGPIPRPDLLIVARGGGSIEDLWGFNEEIVVRAAAASRIPLISAVGHETDTTLIDFAADRRAPTPTAAAEMAVPVRMELLAWTAEQGARLTRATGQRAEMRRQRLADLARGLGRPEALTAPARQRLDLWSDRLGPALHAAATRKRARFMGSAALLRPELLIRYIAGERRGLVALAQRLTPALSRQNLRAGDRLTTLAARLTQSASLASRETGRRRDRLADLALRLSRAPATRLTGLGQHLQALERTLLSLGYTQTLRRGFAVVRAAGQVVTGRAAAEAAPSLEIEFADGRVTAERPAAVPRPRRPSGEGPPGQGSLF